MSQGPIRFQHDTQGVDWQELVDLFKLAELGGREGNKIQRAFENSTVVCFAMDGSRLVGAARALSDREYHATVYDVAIHPDYQRRDVGTQLMNELLATLPVWRVLLVADGESRLPSGILSGQTHRARFSTRYSSEAIPNFLK